MGTKLSVVYFLKVLIQFIVDYFTPQFSVYVTDLEHEELLCLLIGQETAQTKSQKKRRL